MENITTIKQLAVDHRYYCSDHCWNSNYDTTEYETFSDFLGEFRDADIDYNLCFRWDIYSEDSVTGEYKMLVCIMQQRKGKYTPIIINKVTDDDVPNIIEWLTPHREYLKSIWEPFKF